MTEENVVLLERDESGQIATIWLNRPEKRNALNFVRKRWPDRPCVEPGSQNMEILE